MVGPQEHFNTFSTWGKYQLLGPKCKLTTTILVKVFVVVLQEEDRYGSYCRLTSVKLDVCEMGRHHSE